VSELTPDEVLLIFFDVKNDCPGNGDFGKQVKVSQDEENFALTLVC